MVDVTIYSTDYCPYCRRAEAFLKDKGVPFTSVDVTHDPEMREKLVEMTQGLKTVPQIFIDGRSIGGYSDMMTLHQKGQLAPLLGLPAPAP
jgi:glutaredoxin 3